MKRNYDKHTSEEKAKQNILIALLRESPVETPQNRIYGGLSKSSMGYCAYPDYDFKAPQGAAFSVAKVARQMHDDGLILPTEYHRWVLSREGRMAANALKDSTETAK